MFQSFIKSIFQKERQGEIQKAKQEAKELLFQANQEALVAKQEVEKINRKIAQDSIELEKRLARKEQLLEEREKQALAKEQMVKTKEDQMDGKKEEYEKEREKIIQKLEKVAQMTKDEARKFLLDAWEEKLKGEIAKKIRESQEEIKASATEKAKEILIDSMRYGATDYVSEYTLAVIQLPSDDYKGRIIGKDGRNIRAFELATGVDVDLEEEGVIRISSFDAMRREVARLSLEKLIKDGRIQPQRIEEIVKKVKSEVDQTIMKAGEDLAHRVGIFSLPSEVVRLLGQFKFRYSYGQNMILHTLEETKIGISLAHELKADVNTVKLGCLLHDIGKVVTDKEGSHVDLGVDLLNKHRFPKKIVDTVASHHEDVPFNSIEAIIVYIADAVSGGRPGARHEDFKEYLKRITTIEDVAKKQKGVRDVYALQAGRELRVIVRPNEVSDDEATILATTIKEELETKFDTFPGQIKVTVLREYRAEAVAKYN
ncbi:ribonuclease Y [Candidatus Roizmanbacteria bacterium CG_4_9_14_0_2_um_filter_39_13]|uniref:Ribonuclease Y n=2 Tax=Candidatus Roizmaniibacteriota TaxID=1752723 RepID=A0A2M8EY11_9BACT|nr:MAG: ribonuclease Y [Candidatus Roizmanbacteria bacterium CG_4_10_14_0_2_um_filter_39_12]PJC31065.1 MAG: ribonuclease Y [Candidatus Roizmanbacteria bacterium CG_4_9_14_0_2_um_filter_39_13]PJE61875.1 MAG: ribonuclease Y [Candidatus Roizmanbacteria bacterium CG10_big_fil_rev_8_21_14_0_10_39_12]